LVTGVAFPDDETGELISAYGIDFTDDASVRLYYRGDTGTVIDDLMGFLNSKDDIIVARELAERRQLSIGSAFDVVTPRGRRHFVVGGLISPEGLARTLGGRLLVMDLAAAEDAFTEREQISQIDVVVSPDYDVERVQEAVK